MSDQASIYTGKKDSPQFLNLKLANRQRIMETIARSVVRSMGSPVGRRIARGLLGSLLKGR